MMNSLWIAKTGMTAQQTNLDVISHNLANVSTTGFKRNFAVFQDLMYQNHRQVGAQTGDDTQLPTGLHLGLGVNVGSTSRNFMQGSLANTGNALDIGANGQVSITRAGVTTAGPQIELANFVNPAGLEPLGNNLYRETVASGGPQAGNPLTNSLGEIRHKFLENSNINVVEELVSMIQTQRAYEMNSKAIQTSDQMLAKLSQL